MQLTDEQVNIFERDGVVELGEVLRPDEVEDLRARLEHAFFDAGGRLRPDVRDLSEVRDKPLTHSVLQRVNLYTGDAAFERLARRADLVAAVQRLLGSELRLFRDQAFYKPPRAGGELYMHQDNRYWHLEPPHAVTVWIALDPATVLNGCVHFIKGTHAIGRVEHRRAADGESILLEAEADRDLAVPIEVPAGHATVHHCQTLHWSPPNRTTRARRAQTIVYMAADVSCRGEPTASYPLLTDPESAPMGAVRA
jgi:2-oxoglutarate-dependent dioxygenase